MEVRHLFQHGRENNHVTPLPLNTEESAEYLGAGLLRGGRRCAPLSFDNRFPVDFFNF